MVEGFAEIADWEGNDLQAKKRLFASNHRVGEYEE
jgi:hypothetical protein